MFAVKNQLAREMLAEFIGTFFLLLVGCGSNVQALTAKGGNSTSNHMAWGFGFAFAVYLSVNVSGERGTKTLYALGAHLNPAMSFTAWILGNLSFNRVILYTLVQIIGAFAGAGVAFIGHYGSGIHKGRQSLDDINNFDGGKRAVYGRNATAQCFATYPPTHVSVAGSIYDQIVGTSILSGMISLIMDKRYNIPLSLSPLLAGFIIMMIAMSFGAAGAFALNPARDLGPRLFTLAAGYGWEVFSYNKYRYFWVPLTGPFIGSLIGALVYRLFVGMHSNEDTTKIPGMPGVDSADDISEAPTDVVSESEKKSPPPEHNYDNNNEPSVHPTHYI